MNSIKKFFLIFVFLLTVNPLFAQVDFGADVVSRYIFRGLDFGNAVSAQPFLSVTAGNFEIGAWGSYAFTGAGPGAGANENDLYITYSYEMISATITDYYFPEGNKFGFYNNNTSSAHIIEGSLSAEFSGISLLAAYNFYGADQDRSFYFEAGYELYSKDEMSVSAFAGLGNNIYVSDAAGDPTLVNVGVSASKGALSASYILNPDLDTNYLVFGYSIGL
ncbi:MAG: hypothetical protein HND50_09545 [Calditrichaeota bacterium]|nr:hypothetical protein [Calditrichota bacterium]